jgi:hypothetical protein
MAETLSDIAQLSQKILGRCPACLDGHPTLFNLCNAMALPEMGIDDRQSS